MTYRNKVSIENISSGTLFPPDISRGTRGKSYFVEN
jgi:hypothetical protein